MQNALFIGRNNQCPIAYEGALKLKEISYVHAEGYGAGEMKHGPLALIDDSFPTIALAPKDSLYEKSCSNIAEIRARDGKIIAVTTDGTMLLKRSRTMLFLFPKRTRRSSPFLRPFHFSSSPTLSRRTRLAYRQAAQSREICDS